MSSSEAVLLTERQERRHERQYYWHGSLKAVSCYSEADLDCLSSSGNSMVPGEQSSQCSCVSRQGLTKTTSTSAPMVAYSCWGCVPCIWTFVHVTLGCLRHTAVSSSVCSSQIPIGKRRPAGLIVLNASSAKYSSGFSSRWRPCSCQDAARRSCLC
jgi:hypothetical protein